MQEGVALVKTTISEYKATFLIYLLRWFCQPFLSQFDRWFDSLGPKRQMANLRSLNWIVNIKF
jgi:hypothetical protein